jgi:hypothetical protein
MGESSRTPEKRFPNYKVILALFSLTTALYVSCNTYKAVVDLPVEYWESTETLIVSFINDIVSIVEFISFIFMVIL